MTKNIEIVRPLPRMIRRVQWAKQTTDVANLRCCYLRVVIFDLLRDDINEIAYWSLVSLEMRTNSVSEFFCSDIKDWKIDLSLAGVLCKIIGNESFDSLINI